MQIALGSPETYGYASHTNLPALPKLVLSSRILEKQAKRFLTGFPGSTAYAVKANDHPEIIRRLATAGIIHFDVASIPEMMTVREAVPNSILHYHNPARSDEELRLAISRFGCRRFAVDHLSELKKIRSSVTHPGETEIAIRFRDCNASQAVQAFKSKFGVAELEAAQLLQQAKAMGFKVGLTFHPGSQALDPVAYVQHIEAALRIARTAGRDPAFINMGGGFPAKYEGIDSPPLERFFSEIERSANSLFTTNTPNLECEPGRALVAEAGTLITTIKCVRHDRKELFLNDGIYGGLMEVSQFPTLKPSYHVPDMTNGETQEWTVYGPTCDPVDVLPHKLVLPVAIQEGQRIEFKGVGAYSTATATRFNGYGAIEVEVTA